MFVKRNDGLDRVFIPCDVLALVMAALCTVWSGVRGFWIVPMAIGSFLGWWIVLMALWFLIILLFSYTSSLEAPPPKKAHPLYQQIVICFLGILCRGARLRLHLSGEEKLPEGRFLLVSNHRSAFDPIATGWILRKRVMAFVTKPENLRVPMAGRMIYKANYLPIDREDPRRAMETIQNAAELLKNDVVSVGIYPEGTRSRTDEMLPFHNGVFKIAQKANVPIVVMTVWGTEKAPKRTPWHRTDAYLDILEVIPAEELRGSTGALSARVRAIMEEGLARRIEK